MKLYCSKCGRDLNAIWQDNLSEVPGSPLCEDCAGYHKDSTHSGTTKQRKLSSKQVKFLLRHTKWSYLKIINMPIRDAKEKIGSIMKNINRYYREKESHESIT